MISITSLPASHSIKPSDSAASENATQSNLDTGAQVEGEASGTLSDVNSIVPPGGLHPIATTPGTALFGLITDSMRAAIEKSNHPAEPPPPTEGCGLLHLREERHGWCT